MHSNLTTVFVDWSGSFSLNGPLREYSLTENNLRIYSGFHSSLHIPRTSDKSMPIGLYYDFRLGLICFCLILKFNGSFHSALFSSSLLSLFSSAFAFQVTCTTDSGSASSPVIKYSTATGIGTFTPAWLVIGQYLHSLKAESISVLQTRNLH